LLVLDYYGGDDLDCFHIADSRYNIRLNPSNAYDFLENKMFLCYIRKSWGATDASGAHF
jgi:hypothetical protein